MKKTWLHKKCIPAAGLALLFAVQTAMPVQAAAEERLVNAAGDIVLHAELCAGEFSQGLVSVAVPRVNVGCGV